MMIETMTTTATTPTTATSTRRAAADDNNNAHNNNKSPRFIPPTTTTTTIAAARNERILELFQHPPPPAAEEDDNNDDNNNQSSSPTTTTLQAIQQVQQQQSCRFLWSPSLQQEACPRQVLANKFVVVVFGASYCGACKTVRPVMLEFYTSIKERFRQQQSKQKESAMMSMTSLMSIDDEHIDEKLNGSEDDDNDDNDNDDLATQDMEIVFVCMDHTQAAYDMCTNGMPWWCVPFHETSLRDFLVHAYGGIGIPHATILNDCDDDCHDTINEYGMLVHDGLSKIMSDPTGLAFPWRPNQRLVDLLPREYLLARYNNNRHESQSQQQAQRRRPMSDLDEKYLLIYAAAQWCESSRNFTPKLCQAYTELRQQGKNVEILFLSSDKDKDSFLSFWQEKMNFAAIDYDNRRAKAVFADRFQIKSIPSLLLFGPRPADGDDDRPLLNANARCTIEQAVVSQQVHLSSRMADFPHCFLPPRYGDLNHMTDSLNSVSCVIVFCHGADSEEQEHIQRALKGAATLAAENCSVRGSTADWRFLWSCLPTPFSNTLQEALRLEPRQCQAEEPLMVLLDIPDNGAFYIHQQRNDNKDNDVDDDAITRASILDFVQNPGKRHQI